MTEPKAGPRGGAPRDAATVMLVRDGDAGLEVFMLRRTLRSEFSAGAYVFPGGAVDPGDHALAASAAVSGLGEAEANSRLGLAAGGLAFWVAAIRECFEEAGVLLAIDRGAEFIALDGAAAQRFSALRRALNAGEIGFDELCAAEQLRLPLERVHYYAHWITPEGMPKRYDTRFFVCQAPPRQVPLHDGEETVDHCWVTPRAALDSARRRDFHIVPVTRKQLESMLPFERAQDFIAHAAARRDIPTIVPEVTWGRDGRPEAIILPLPEGPEHIDVRGGLA